MKCFVFPAMVMVFAGFPIALSAQWPDYKTPGVPRTPDGKPKLDAPTPLPAPLVSGLAGLPHRPPRTGTQAPVVYALATGMRAFAARMSALEREKLDAPTPLPVLLGSGLAGLPHGPRRTGIQAPVAYGLAMGTRAFAARMSALTRAHGFEPEVRLPATLASGAAEHEHGLQPSP